MDAMTLRGLAQRQALADGIEVRHGHDLEFVIRRFAKLAHVIITSENQMYINGWLSAHTTGPDLLGGIKVHDRLTEEDIQRRAKRFTDNLRSKW